MSSPMQKIGMVFTYNNKPHENKAPLPNVPIPVPKVKANYMPMNRIINSTNPTSMRSIIRIPAGSCSSCGH